MSEQPPQPKAWRPPAPLADYDRRVVAYLIDWALMLLLIVLVAVVLGLITGEADAGLGVGFLLWSPVVLFYSPLLMIRTGQRNGQTIGKQFLKIRVARINDQPVTFRTAAIRQMFGQWLLGGLFTGVYLFIDYLWPLKDPQRQALHDKMARTVVIDVPSGVDWMGPTRQPKREAGDALAGLSSGEDPLAGLRGETSSKLPGSGIN